MSKVVFGQKNERTVERVVNLALFPINLYEDNTGRIFHYDFCKAPTVVFEETEADKTDQRPKIYVVDDELLEHFKKEILQFVNLYKKYQLHPENTHYLHYCFLHFLYLKSPHISILFSFIISPLSYTKCQYFIKKTRFS